MELSLSERIKNLKANGENEWKKRVVGKNITTVTKISDAKSLLDESTTTWKARVATPDTDILTVAGKLSRDNIIIPEQPPQQQEQEIIKANFILTTTSSNGDDSKKIISCSSSSLSNFNPSDYETFGSFFSAPHSNNSLSDNVVMVENLDLEREELIRAKIVRPRKPNSAAQQPRKKLSAAEKVKRALEAKESYDSVQLKEVNEVEEEEEFLWVFKGLRVVMGRIQLSNEISLGDCYVRRDGNEIFVFKGPYANLKETLKADEFVRNFKRKNDTITMVTYNGKNWSRFLSLNGLPLNYDARNSRPLGDHDDNEYEMEMLSRIKCYRFKENCFVAMGDEEDFLDFDWLRGGSQQQQGASLLYDFGGDEVYLYNISSSDSPVAMEIINEKFLPNCRLFKRVKKYLEPPGFRIKFGVKPAIKSGGIVARQQKEKDEKMNFRLRFDDCDEIYDEIVIENVSFGVTRGVIVMEEDPREVTYKTQNLQKWRVGKRGITPLKEEDQLRAFYSGDCYVILWNYNLVYSTRRLASGAVNASCGRDRAVWFFWFGSRAEVQDKGRVSALFAVEDYKQILLPDSSLSAGDLNSSSSGCGSGQIALTEGAEPSLFHMLFNKARYYTNAHDNQEKEIIFKINFLYLSDYYHFKEVDEISHLTTTTHHGNKKIYLSEEDEDKRIESCFHDYEKVIIEEAHPLINRTPSRIFRLTENKKGRGAGVLVEQLMDRSSCCNHDNQATYLKEYNKEKKKELILTTMEINPLSLRLLFLSVYESFGNCTVVTMGENKEEDLETICNFINSFNENRKIKNEKELAQFRRFYGDDKVWKFVHPDFIQQENYNSLPSWKQKLKCRDLLMINKN